MTVSDINFNDILLNKKSRENTLIYEVSYKTFMREKPLRIRYDKIDGLIKVCDGIRWNLVICNCWLYGEIYNRIRYLINEKVVLQI